MRCSASPTTSTVAEPNDRTVAQKQMNAILFSQILKPLAASLGQFGDVAIDAVVQKSLVGPVR